MRNLRLNFQALWLANIFLTTFIEEKKVKNAYYVYKYLKKSRIFWKCYHDIVWKTNKNLAKMSSQSYYVFELGTIKYNKINFFENWYKSNYSY